MVGEGFLVSLLIPSYQNFLTSCPVMQQKTKRERPLRKGLFSLFLILVFKGFSQIRQIMSLCLTFRNAAEWLNLFQRPFLTEGLKIKPLGFPQHQLPVIFAQRLSGQWSTRVCMRNSRSPSSAASPLPLLFCTLEMLFFPALFCFQFDFPVVRTLHRRSTILTHV